MSDKKKWNVLIVHNYYQIPGGEDIVVANEKDMLEKHGHNVILYSRDNSELKEMGNLQKIIVAASSLFNFRTYHEVKRIIKKNNIHIVHVHNTLTLISPSVYYAARICRVPIIQTIHNFRLLCPGATFYRNGHICEACVAHNLGYAIKYGCYRESRLQSLICVINTKFHRMTGIYRKINYICLTEFNKEKLSESKQISCDQIFVKPNFVKSVEIFVPETKRTNQFIFAGRLDKSKGIEILLKAWKEMGRTAPKIIICGIGPLQNWCKKFITDNHINAVLEGFVPNIEVRKLIADSRALILPTQWYEGFPMSILEAYSVGTPVICSDLGNAGSLVIDGVTGRKFKTGSVCDLIKAIKTCQGMCESTLYEYKNKYTENKNYEKLKECYDNAK